MANTRIVPLPFLLLQVLVLAAFLHGGAAIGGRVGGRTPVKNVEENTQVQELGRYCVREYNRQLQSNGSTDAKLLVFSQVVEAETQVVSGIKYYLTISAATAAGPPETFQAVVVVKSWLRSKVLLDFAPSKPPTSTK